MAKRGRPDLWHFGRRLRALWKEQHARTGIGLLKQTEIWASGHLPKDLYPHQVTAEALRKAIRRSVRHRVRDLDGHWRTVPTVLAWAVTGSGGGHSGGQAATGVSSVNPSGAAG
jgi:hypothetical protein